VARVIGVRTIIVLTADVINGVRVIPCITVRGEHN
jgi:hypothetical protein